MRTVLIGFLLFHLLHKTEHFVRPFVTLVSVVRLMLRAEMLAPKLVDHKPAFVDVKVDITLFKIRCAGFPNNRFGVHAFYLEPRSVANALAVLVWQSEQYLQVIVMDLLVYFQYNSTDVFAIDYYAIGFIVSFVYAALDGFS